MVAMMHRALCLMMVTLMLPTGACTSRPAEPPPRTASLIYPPGIDPARTSDDPQYGYTPQQPVRIGPLAEDEDPQAAAHMYLSHLRDANFQPMRFGMIEPGLYELIGPDATTYRLYLDVQPGQPHPLDAAAPKGLYLWRCVTRPGR